MLRAGSALRVASSRARGQPPEGWTPPYSLPGVGQVVAIGENTSNSVYPSERSWTTGEWDYANFGSYGGGTFAPDFSDGGAFVIASAGGHNHPDNVDPLVFDFADATWKRLVNSNGVLHKTTGTKAFLASETNGSPYYEITGSSVPAPPHPYAQQCVIPLGSKGSVILFGRASTCVESNMSSGIHRFDLASQTWSRLTDNTVTRMAMVECDSLYDAGRNRIWGLNSSLHNYQTLFYLNLSTYDVTETATYGWPDTRIGDGYFRSFMHEGLIMRQGGTGTLWYFDPDDASAGWGQCTVTGTMPAGINRFVRFGTGNYYWRGESTGNTLTRLQPPANPKTGTWVVDTVSLSGPTMANFDPAFGGGVNHYTNLIYVPAINCLAWLPGSNNSVYLARPE